MNIVFLILIGVVGIVLGMYFASRRSVGGLLSKQSQKKAENKERVLELVRANKKTTNNDIEKLLGVSDATATRYFDELEKEGKVKQIGTTGNAVFYILK